MNKRNRKNNGHRIYNKERPSSDMDDKGKGSMMRCGKYSNNRLFTRCIRVC